MRNLNFFLLIAGATLLTACAGNTPSLDTRSDSDCPVGQVLVCQDSRLNEKSVCICRRKDPF